ncbi:uncharacterized protein KY384_006816 [Bacidia gigantensis]|uniref:uncharacterized protein n=1 Tax=Bacidia gigantensis TaxID=2732470 RepID=UPI001D039D2E|nr:uncharacterized protein KY384_006816 [Bacidia gigantensis]KAG8527900.1 hypothetical protein KY384_006816 [Bacidia gigantensis]
MQGHTVKKLINHTSVRPQPNHLHPKDPSYHHLPQTPHKMTAAHHYHFNIAMSCGGCSGAVERVLKKTEGLADYKVDLATQTADVYTDDVSYETVLEKIKKTGKEVKGAEKDGAKAEI